jgi:hypothetical protein
MVAFHWQYKRGIADTLARPSSLPAVSPAVADAIALVVSVSASAVSTLLSSVIVCLMLGLFQSSQEFSDVTLILLKASDCSIIGNFPTVGNQRRKCIIL